MDKIFSNDCKHLNFQVETRVGRLYSDEEAPDVITQWRLDIHVNCKECLMPFRFVGLPGGFMPNVPTMSADELEGRLIITPI